MRLLLSGACGRMGRAIAEVAQEELVGVDTAYSPLPFPLFSGFEGVPICDALIDFSTPKGTEAALKWAREHGVPAVIGTTGHTEAQLLAIERAAQTIPILLSGNFSLAVALMEELVERVAHVLDYDAEVIETHHRNKRDAPSGTALQLYAAIARSRESEAVYLRHGTNKLRERQDVGIHSVRGGSVVGIHEVRFLGEGEMLTLTHTAESRSIFARGALAAAHKIISMPPALYSLRDMIR